MKLLSFYSDCAASAVASNFGVGPRTNLLWLRAGKSVLSLCLSLSLTYEHHCNCHFSSEERGLADCPWVFSFTCSDSKRLQEINVCCLAVRWPAFHPANSVTYWNGPAFYAVLINIRFKINSGQKLNNNNIQLCTKRLECFLADFDSILAYSVGFLCVCSISILGLNAYRDRVGFGVRITIEHSYFIRWSLQHSRPNKAGLKCLSVRPYMCMFVCSQNVSLISMKFGI